MRSVFVSLASLASLAPLFFAATAFAQVPPPPVPSAPAGAAPAPPGAAAAAGPGASPPSVPPVAPTPAAAALLPVPLPPPPPPPPASSSPLDIHLDLSTLRALREKEAITEAEYDAATRDLNETTGSTIAREAPTFVLGKFSTTFYGMMKSDFLYDSTQSFSDLAGNGLVQRPNGSTISPLATQYTTYPGDHPQAQFSIHDSRLGMYIRAPETSGVRVSGLLEMDMFGLSQANSSSQSQFFASSVPRVRHAYFRIETPVVDILVGQYWHLFGWQNLYHPASAQAQGLVGEIYSRDPQIRISKTVKTRAITFEIAAAALRPPESGSAVPQAEAGLRFAFDKWRGVMTNGASGTGVQSLSVAVTGNFRDVVLPELSLLPKDTVNLGMESVAGDVFIPIVPIRKENRNNALSLHGEIVYGSGISDLYTNLTGGMNFPFLPLTQATGTQLPTGTTYPQTIDNGMVAFDLQGNLHAIQWTSFLVGAQYYLPIANGRVFVAANYSHMESNNIAQFAQDFGTTGPDPNTEHQNASIQSVRKSIDFYDADIFADVVSGVRVGVEGALYQDHYVDGVEVKNVRVDVAGMFMF